ncbi:MAG: GNAT family N-acetyltransferase [Bacteroidales bacterium]|nr:GNAT family N-acetyltransferase [Bacteroidales bacterium]
MKAIIPPVDRELIEKELTKEKFLRETNNGNNKLYIITHKDSPNIMQEIGRLRELTFRAAGGGTGKETDIDAYDISDDPYKQLIVWDPAKKDILGGYRYYMCCNAQKKNNGEYNLATSRLFNFSEKFIKDYLPYTIELGRSFVQPAYQNTNRNSKGLFALDNLWDGLGAIWMNNKNMKYFFGKVTMYTDYNRDARDLILYFFEKNFFDTENLLVPIDPLIIDSDKKKLAAILNGNDFQEDLKILSQKVRTLGEMIPPLINAYCNLSPTLRSFGTAINHHFGEVEETAIMVTLKDIYSSKVERHINTYIPNKDFTNN